MIVLRGGCPLGSYLSGNKKKKCLGKTKAPVANCYVNKETNRPRFDGDRDRSPVTDLRE